MSKCTIKRNENKEIKSIEVARLHERFNNNAIDIFNRVVDNIAKRLGLTREEYSKRLGIISAQRSVRETIESITNKTMTNYYNEVDTGLIEDDILFQAPIENNKILDFVEGLDPKKDAGLIKALHASPTFLEAMDSVGSNVNTELRQQLNTAQREIQEYYKNKDASNPRVAELKKQITELKEKIEQSENLSSRITKEEARRLLESDFQSLYDEATTTDKYLIEEYTEEFILGAIDYERNRANNELLAQGWEQVLKSKREGTEYYKQNLAGRKEEQRANLVANVKGLKTNKDLPIEFKYLMLDAVLNYYVNPKGYYARRTNSTVSLHNNLSYKVLPSVYEDYLEDSDTNLLMSYYKNKDKEFLTEEQRREVGEKYIVEETDRGYYLKIPQNGTEADVDALYQLTRESHRHPACWCTGAAVATAKGHNNEGDFYLFVDKEFNIKLAFRYSGNSLVEARGLGEGQLILEEDAQDAKYFYDKYPNAKAYEKHYYFNKYYREHIIEKKPIESKELLFSVAKVIFAGDGSYKNSDDKKKALREFVEESIKKDSERLGLKGNEVVFSAKDFTKDTVISFANVIIRADSDSEYKLEYAPFVSPINNHPNKETVTLKFGNIESNNINIDDKIKVVAKSVTATAIDLSKESTIVSDSLSTDFIQLIGKDIRIKTKKANIQNFIVRGYNNIIEGVKYIEKILVEYDRYYTPYHTSADATFIGLEEAGSIEGRGSKIYAPDLKKVDEIFVHDGVFEAEKLRQVNSDFTTGSSIVFASKLSEVGGEFNTYSTSGNLSSMEPHLFPSDFRHIKGTYSEYLANGIREEKEERNRFETLNQDERGAIIKFPLSSIIVLGKNADDTTPLHEIAHEYERVLTNRERNKILDWAGHKEWTRETSEAFAKGFERYLYEGTEPESIFKQFAEYLKDLIEDAIAYFGGIDELNQDMRDIYALMVEQSGEASAQRSFERIAEPLGNNIYAIENSLDYFNRTISYTSYFTKEEKIGKERTEVQPAFLSKLYDNYSKAIGRTSDYRGRVVQHIDRGAGQVYKPFENDSSSLVGFLTELDDTNSVFIVSHFAPSSLRSGVKLLNQALNEETPFVFAVPTYQADQLQKMGYHYVTTTEQYFNGEMVEKHVFTNKDLELEENKYLNEYIEEYIEENSYNQGPLNFMLLGEKGASNLPEDRQLTRNLVQYLNENTSNNISILTTEEIKKDLEKRTVTKELTNTEGTIYGYHDPNTGEIILNSDVLNSRTLFHELTHANEKLIKTAAQNGDTKAQAILEKREDILKESGFDKNKARQDYREAKGKTKNQSVFTTIAPYYNTPLTTENKEEVTKAIENDFKNKAKSIADAIGIEIASISTNIGGFEFQEGDIAGQRVKELSYTFELKNATTEQADLFASFMGDLGYENQEAVISYNYLEENDNNADAFEITIPINDVNSALETLDRVGVADFTINEKTKEIKLLNFDLSNREALSGTIINIIADLNKNNNYDSTREQRNEKIASRYIVRRDRQSTYRNGLKTSGLREQERLWSLYTQAEEAVSREIGTDDNNVDYQKESAYLPRPNETEDEYVERMKSEHFATLMEEARLAPESVKQSLFQKITDWIRGFYQWLTGQASINDLTNKEILNLSLNEFRDRLAIAMLNDEFVVGEIDDNRISRYAEEYKFLHKRNNRRPHKVIRLNTELSKEIAEAYEKRDYITGTEEVDKSYKALIEETKQQYEFIVGKGLKVERYQGKGEPYSSSREMLEDIRKNNHIYFLANEEAFGDNTTTADKNIGLQKSGIKLADGYEMTNSELFRVVHDYFGHGVIGNGFGPIGEENATLQHLNLFSNIAKPALVFQTRGQNSWVNFSGANKEVLNDFKRANELRKEGKIEEADALQKSAQERFKFAKPIIGIFKDIYNFSYYDTARRIRETRRVEGANLGRDKQDRELSSALSQYNVQIRSKRGINRRHIRGTKRLGGFYVKPITEYTLDKRVENGIKVAFPKFKGNQKIYEITDGEVYRNLMVESLKDNKYKSSVTIHSAEDFSKMRMFVTEDGSTGITITKDGFLGGAFSNPDANRPNNLSQLMVLGIKEGAMIAEAFDTVLPDYYSAFGFKVVSLTEFNDDYKPDGWIYEDYKKFNNGKPDVVFLIYDGGSRNFIEDKLGQFDLYSTYQKSFTEKFDKVSYEEAYAFMERKALNRVLYGIKYRGEIGNVNSYHKPIDFSIKEPIIQRQESELAKELIAIPFLTQEEAVSAYANIFNNNFDWRESNCK